MQHIPGMTYPTCRLFTHCTRELQNRLDHGQSRPTRSVLFRSWNLWGPSRPSALQRTLTTIVQRYGTRLWGSFIHSKDLVFLLQIGIWNVGDCIFSFFFCLCCNKRFKMWWLHFECFNSKLCFFSIQFVVVYGLECWWLYIRVTREMNLYYTGLIRRYHIFVHSWWINFIVSLKKSIYLHMIVKLNDAWLWPASMLILSYTCFVVFLNHRVSMWCHMIAKTGAWYVARYIRLFGFWVKCENVTWNIFHPLVENFKLGSDVPSCIVYYLRFYSS